MSKSDLVQFEGRIVKICSNGLYKVQLDKKDIEVSA